MKSLGSPESYSADDLTLGAASSVVVKNPSAKRVQKALFHLPASFTTPMKPKKKTVTEGKFDVTVLKMY